MTMSTGARFGQAGLDAYIAFQDLEFDSTWRQPGTVPGLSVCEAGSLWVEASANEREGKSYEVER